MLFMALESVHNDELIHYHISILRTLELLSSFELHSSSDVLEVYYMYSIC